MKGKLYQHSLYPVQYLYIINHECIAFFEDSFIKLGILALYPNGLSTQDLCLYSIITAPTEDQIDTCHQLEEEYNKAFKMAI